MDSIILFHILVKNKEPILEFWLEQNLEKTTYPKKNIILFIRTNNNTDSSKEILINWIEKNRDLYKEIIFEDQDVEEKVEQFDVHEWNETRFQVLSRLRQEGIQKAINLNTDFYFVCDVDNFLLPNTLLKLVETKLPIVAPLLKYACSEDDYRPGYSNFHHPVNEYGYFVNSETFSYILNRIEPGLHLVDLVHCTYLIKKNVLDKISYTDGTTDYEYVIFSRNVRKEDIPQILDTRQIYGCITLTENLNNCKNYMENLELETENKE